jgi:hypothetical protein
MPCVAAGDGVGCLRRRCGAVERIEVPITIRAKKKGLGSLVLHRETKRIKFDGDKIITSEFAHEYEIFNYGGRNKYIL